MDYIKSEIERLKEVVMHQRFLLEQFSAMAKNVRYWMAELLDLNHQIEEANKWIYAPDMLTPEEVQKKEAQENKIQEQSE